MKACVSAGTRTSLREPAGMRTPLREQLLSLASGQAMNQILDVVQRSTTALDGDGPKSNEHENNKGQRFTNWHANEFENNALA